MSTPKLCPLFVAAALTEHTECNENTPGNLPDRYVVCLGSRCAAWTAAGPRFIEEDWDGPDGSLRCYERDPGSLPDGMGRCAHLGGDPYPDPAAEPKQ